VPDVAGVSLRQHEIFDQGRRSQAGQRGRREHARLDYQRAEQGDRQHLEVWFSLWRHVKGRLAWRVVRVRPRPLLRTLDPSPSRGRGWRGRDDSGILRCPLISQERRL